MSNTAIKVENLSKIYRLGEIGTGSIGQDVDRWFKTKVLGKEDPFLKIGEANDRANKGNSDIVYSLRDINFEIQQGDAVGIIGRNGAGKSTLLKILSRVTTPTTGKINIKGRVASLLEVGTGFHPELTGRENIYLNGAILGMRKREIDRKLDEIIDFSGVERYIDTPVKRYSSGMYVRLAFAVAAHLESEILIVDEVLAVGDAEFQKKCLGKMGEVSKGEGRTVLFVSHNMAAVQSLCNKGIMLKNGRICYNAGVNDLVQFYTSDYSQKNSVFINDRKGLNNDINLISVRIKQGTNNDVFYIEEETSIILDFKLETQQKSVSTSIHLNCMGAKVFCVGDDSLSLDKGHFTMEYKIPKNFLNTENYSIDVYLIFNVTDVQDQFDEVLSFKMEERADRKEYVGVIGGVVRPVIPYTKSIQI
jgi:ABC-type polysaccharide/polyol phosphate transport system ATPase subunit